MVRTSADVEREVEATRGQIDQTVEALKEKMQPRELFDEATRIMGTTGNKLLTTVVNEARENPIPIALIGAGLAWLVLSQGRKGRGADYDDYPARGYYETYEGYDEEERLRDRLAAKARGALENARQRFAEVKDKATDALGHARTGAADGMGDVRGRVSSFASEAQHRAGDVGRRVQARYRETLQTEPLILAALGLAVGAAIGASLPASRVERRYLGPARDKVVDRGRDLAHSGLDEVRGVAERAYGQVKEELQRQSASGETRSDLEGRIAH